MSKKKDGDAKTLSSQARRNVLRRLGRFAAVSAPTVTLLLAAETKPAAATVSTCKALCAPAG